MNRETFTKRLTTGSFFEITNKQRRGKYRLKDIKLNNTDFNDYFTADYKYKSGNMKKFSEDHGLGGFYISEIKTMKVVKKY